MSPEPAAPPAARPAVHRHPRTARFGDCDPVGIVYFPRYFDWFHLAMESWFEQGLGQPYAELLQRVGLPTVHTECDYAQPCAFGDRVVVELRVGRIGRSSLRLCFQVVGEDGVLRAKGLTDVVLVQLSPGAAGHLRPTPIPEALRARMAAYLHPPEGSA